MTDFNMDGSFIELNGDELEEGSGGKGNGGSFIKTTGNVYVRKGPGLDYGIITSLPSGTIISYLGSTKKDDRGVAWYKVNCNGSVGWVSSKYAKFK